MAGEDAGAEEKTEEATPQKREDAREKGQVASSRDLTSVFVLAASVAFVSSYVPTYVKQIERMMVTSFEALSTRRVDQANVLDFAFESWSTFMWLIIPIFGVTLVVATGTTFLQTRFAFSWKRAAPDWSRLDPLEGIKRLANVQAFVELIKSIAKMLAVGTVTYLILMSEWVKVPQLMTFPILASWRYWGEITTQLFWAVCMMLVLIGAGDFIYSWFSLEKQLKMTKQEVKEDFKRQEGDPLIKRRRERLARELVNRKVIEKTREATVLVTNPTHYSIALRYEIGMEAPILVAKGIDHLALRMREVAKERKIPIIENRPLARELYASVKEGQEIPQKLYKAVAEIIRYVYRLKNRPIKRRETPTQQV